MMLKLFYKSGKNAQTSDLKCYNYTVYPAEVILLFNN